MSAVAEMCGASRSAVARTWADGTAKITRSAWRTTAGSAVTDTASGSRIPGRFSAFSRSRWIRSALSGRRASSATGSRAASIAAIVVPQAPVPATTMCGSWAAPFVPGA